MFSSGLTLHETLDLHEILSFKTVGISKASAMISFVTDPELKSIMEADIQVCSRHTRDIQNLLSKALQ